ncbi:MAG: DUF120 domain-containing protein [Phycisphaerae bacterium]|nr:DUF120 domain-containing protein [Phycisphaerae bacterium]
MITVRGIVREGRRNASKNFSKGDVPRAVAEVLGVQEADVVPGTLNVHIDQLYADLDDGEYDCELDRSQYNGKEWVKIKRCKVDGLRSVVIRPKEHFEVRKFEKRIEIMSSVHLRTELDLQERGKVEVQFQGDDSWWNARGPG